MAAPPWPSLVVGAPPSTSRGCGWAVHVASQIKSSDHTHRGLESTCGGSIYPWKLANPNARGF